MVNPAFSGKVFSVIIVAGAIVTGYLLHGKRSDRIAVIESMNAIQAKRDFIAASQKSKENL